MLQLGPLTVRCNPWSKVKRRWRRGGWGIFSGLFVQRRSSRSSSSSGGFLAVSARGAVDRGSSSGYRRPGRDLRRRAHSFLSAPPPRPRCSWPGLVSGEGEKGGEAALGRGGEKGRRPNPSPNPSRGGERERRVTRRGRRVGREKKRRLRSGITAAA